MRLPRHVLLPTLLGSDLPPSHTALGARARSSTLPHCPTTSVGPPPPQREASLAPTTQVHGATAPACHRPGLRHLSCAENVQVLTPGLVAWLTLDKRVFVGMTQLEAVA